LAELEVKVATNSTQETLVKQSLTIHTEGQGYEKGCKEKAVFTAQRTLYYTHKRTKTGPGQLYQVFQFFDFIFDSPRYYDKFLPVNLTYGTKQSV
jgi:hypothetical protein